MLKKSSSDRGEQENRKQSHKAQPLSDKIGSNLKKLYDDVLDEDIPDDFLALLAKADEQK